MRWRTGVDVRRLAPHVSLKQPFEVGDDLSKVQKYFTAFAASVPPQALTLSGLTVWDTVFAVAVKEKRSLRTLHDRLNAELPTLFEKTGAEHDGYQYQFHVTVARGGASPETFRALHGHYEANPPAFTSATFVAHELALFVYNEPTPGEWEYLSHTILPLSGNPDA